MLARGLGPFALAALMACGPGAPEERLAQAREEFEETRSTVQDLEERVEVKRDAVRRAEEALAKARGELEQAENELSQAREKIEARATDVALFRAVQTALLESEELEGVAIRAEVKDGRVTLHGEVGERALAEEALEVARSAAGLDKVSSEIRVREARDDES
jgi:osmotically-inducible protein OsmY